jgi:chromosome segregation ATPase
MKGIFSHLVSQQTPPPDTGEGLPYWIFWLLLCVILLLVAFIFLRDKDLRRRLNLFLFGAKKKLIKIRLQARLKRGYRKKSEIMKELGKKVWEDDIKIPEKEKISQELTKLQQNKESLEKESEDVRSKTTELEADLGEFIRKHQELLNEQILAKKPYHEKLETIKNEGKNLETTIIQKQKELEGLARGIQTASRQAHTLNHRSNPPRKVENDKTDKINSKIRDLQSKKDETDNTIMTLVEKRLNLEKERKILQEKCEEFDKKHKKVEEGGKKRIKEFQKEIKEWQKDREKLREKIEDIEKKKVPLFERLGIKAGETRLHQEKLSLFYSQIDHANERIRELEKQIKDL